MKLSSALATLLVILPNSAYAGLRGIKDDVEAQPNTNIFNANNNGSSNSNNGANPAGGRPGKPDLPPSAQAAQGNKPNLPPNANAGAVGNSKRRGQILLGKGQGKGLGKIDKSSLSAAQQGAKGILQSLSKNGDKEKFVAKNSNANHLRFTQEVNGIEVEGAALFVHTDGNGEVTGINGEMVDGVTVPSAPTLDAVTSTKAALEEAHVPASAHGQCTDPTLTVVRGQEDGGAHLAWTCTVRYDTVDEYGVATPHSDKIFARATGEKPGLIQSFPQIYGAASVGTYSCNNAVDVNDIVGGATCNTLISSSPDKISTGDDAADAAHNNAIDTFEYYLLKFGRDSIDANGMTLRSSVHVGNNYVNAFWYRDQMWYGDGSPGTSKALSMDLDVVAHELTHGVTQKTSGLIYQNESGALNEAMSDIMAAFIEQANGADDRSTWLLGEDIWEAGEALRSMCDPAAMGDYDYYPTRYVGSADHGGVHSNSGIANLAACLLVKGGTHPRGKTSTNVSGIGFDAAADIFYQANTNCMTPSANFEQARFCTADIYGGASTESVHAAWDAVGVVDNFASYDANLGVPKCSTVGQSCRSGGSLLSGVSLSSELNAPNTLDGCQDGTYGTQWYDESVEAIEVAAVGGKDTQLIVGAQAVVKAAVYAWSSGSQDTADFYYADDVNNPAWKLIGSVPAQKGGYQTLTSPEFTIPDSDLVAVRSVFRYIGVESPCPGGYFDDVDDLVFAVARNAACVDTPGWADSYGDSCEWYEAHDTSGCPLYGDMYGTALGTPNEACCFCGGGQ